MDELRLLRDFVNWFDAKKDRPTSPIVGSDITDFLKSRNNMSECERQPVGNNEQGGNKCNHACGSSITTDGTYCHDCGENTEV